MDESATYVEHGDWSDDGADQFQMRQGTTMKVDGTPGREEVGKESFPADVLWKLASTFARSRADF